MQRATIHFAVFTVLLTLSAWCVSARPVAAETVAQRVAGRIVLQVEQHGEAWYVSPRDLHRYFMGSPTDALHIMGRLGDGITDANLAKIPVPGSTETGDWEIRNRLSGYILLQVEQHGEGWYVYPRTKQRYYLGRPVDAFAVMGKLGLGITDADLATIPIGTIVENTDPAGLNAVLKTVVTSRGTYLVDVVSFDRTGKYKLKTDTGNTANCATNCTVLSLRSYLTRRSGLAGIHGTYFCPADYSSCASTVNYYFYPVYNSFSNVMINDDRIKFTVEPMMVFDTANKLYYYHHASDFKSQTNFEATKKVTLRSAISNGPAMVEAGKNVLDVSLLDSKQLNTRSYRGALGVKGNTISLIVVHTATIVDSAAVLTAMGMDYALNLDGGGSTALYSGGKYVLGPGRSLPNAVLITP